MCLHDNTFRLNEITNDWRYILFVQKAALMNKIAFLVKQLHLKFL